VNDLGQRGGIEQPVAPLRGGVHQGTVLGFELGLEGVDTVMCLAALPSTDRKQSSMLIVAVRTAQRCDPKIADGERMGIGK